MSSTTPIPSSPIPQPTQKIGTRYVAVERVPAPHGAYIATTAASHPFTVPRGYDLYPLLDPADAAELERLRKVEESAADRHIEDANLGTPEQASASFAAWVKVRDERIAFEKKIGGGK